MRWFNADNLSVRPGETVERRHSAVITIPFLVAVADLSSAGTISAFAGWTTDQVPMSGASDTFELGLVQGVEFPFFPFAPQLIVTKLDSVGGGAAGSLSARGVRSGVRAGGQQVAGRATGVAPDAPEPAGGWGGSPT
jgi:hypothetical protein